jgi:hypothetical protein
MDFKYKYHIPNSDIQLYFNDSINSYDIRGMREVKVISSDIEFTMMIDERFNECDFIYDSIDKDTSKNKTEIYLKKKYEDLKKSDFRYKNGKGIESTKTIKLEDFINFIKTESRNSTIEKILL